MKKQYLDQCLFMLFQKFFHITQVYIIEMLMEYLRVMVFYLIMSLKKRTNFCNKKIIQALVRIRHNKQKYLTLGNLYAVRDWGHAIDYVESMWKILI